MSVNPSFPTSTIFASQQPLQQNPSLVQFARQSATEAGIKSISTNGTNGLHHPPSRGDADADEDEDGDVEMDGGRRGAGNGSVNGHGGQENKTMNVDVKGKGKVVKTEQKEEIVPSVPEITAVKGIVPTLQNIVATVNLGTRLDLKTIALHARNAEYNPKRFAAVIMRIRDPKTTALIFASGKMVVTGAKSEDDSRLASRKYARIIQKLGFDAKFESFKIQNIVGSCDVKFPIRLEGLSFAHVQFSSYEPELFPGLIYRMHQPKVVLLIFVSGKIVLTGAKVREEIYMAFDKIYTTLVEFRKS